MKTIGLIGGMSWESSALYYRLINEEVRAILGKSRSSKCLMYSFDFQEIEEMQHSGQWPALKDRMYEAGSLLKRAGADFIVLCTNTMHKVMDSFEKDVGIPLLHVVDVVGEAVRSAGLKKVGLLGTKFTMEEDFYRMRLEDTFNIGAIIPDEAGREAVNRVIYRELVRGIISEESRREYYRIMDGLADRGAEGVILGCTEIGLLVKEHRIKLFDSTVLHAREAANLSVL